MQKIKLIIFDVNQTMFSLNIIENEFTNLGISPLYCDIWFNSVLKEGFALNNINKFISFNDIGISILTNILNINRLETLKKYQKNYKNFNKLNPVNGLVKSKEILRMATLTNGNKDTTYELLLKNNLDKFITKTFSIDDRMPTFSKVTHLMVTKYFGIKPENTLMVACHSWDLEGAKNVGLQIGYVKTTEVLPEYIHSPDYQGKNILELSKDVLRSQQKLITSI